MTDWLKLDPSKFSEARDKIIHGVHVEVFSSPYDVPEAIRGIYNKDSERLIIEFKYIGGDEPEINVDGDHLTLRVGKHSNRLYKIEIPWSEEDMRAHSKLKLSLPKLDKVFENLVKRPGAARRTTNYEVTKKILSERVEELSQQVAA